MTLDKLSQITEVGIKSGITLRNINVEGAYVSGVVTATTLNAVNYTGNVTGNINPATLNVTGVSTFNANVFLGDGDIAYFGDGNDLLIFHNSTDSIIRDTGTGDLYIEGGNRIRLTSPTALENYAIFNQDGAVELYYDNVKRFETTSSGVTITGNLTASSAIISGVTTVSAGSTSAPSISPSGNSNTGIFFPSTNTTAVSYGGTEALRIDSNGRLGIGDKNPTGKLTVEGQGIDSIVLSSSSGATPTFRLINGTGTYQGGLTGWKINYRPNYASGSGTGPDKTAIELINSSPNTSANIALLADGGNVGVGTNNPLGALEVQKSLPYIISNYNNSKHLGMSVGGSSGGMVLTTGNFYTINHQPFSDRGTDNNLTERVRINANGMIKAGGDGGMWIYTKSGSTSGSSTFSVDFTWYAGGANSLWVLCWGSHWVTGYEAIRRAFLVGDNGTGFSVLDDYNNSTGNSGGWTFTRPSGNTLRITKTAGSYGGGFNYQILVLTQGNAENFIPS